MESRRLLPGGLVLGDWAAQRVAILFDGASLNYRDSAMKRGPERASENVPVGADRMDEAELREKVRKAYGEAARGVGAWGAACSASACGCSDPITANLYSDAETGELPAEALEASLGCGNPAALAQLSPGEIVLDLGSGGGIDVLLSARRVGPRGKAYGLDMTDEMLELARDSQRKAGVSNAEFLKGEIENIPLPDGSVDVIISNCVINLSADKGRVMGEAFRVLRPGGRFAVSDIVVRGMMPEEIRRSMELWMGCLAGALEEAEYRARLQSAGFEMVEIQPTRIYTADDARRFLKGSGLEAERIAPLVDGKFMSAFVRAHKPVAAKGAKLGRDNEAH
jgi:arsenite methyltransferase